MSHGFLSILIPNCHSICMRHMKYENKPAVHAIEFHIFSRLTPYLGISMIEQSMP